MTNLKTGYQKFDHNAYAKTRAPDDFWGQIRRTVEGAPVSDDQIRMIVEAINSGLTLKPDDVLLDLACGNGALSYQFFNKCKEFLGVDFSEYLISVAKKNFETEGFNFVEMSAGDYVQQEKEPEKFTKALCYGSFSYFPQEDAEKVLRLLFEKFINVRTVFIGNLPDRDRAEKFYKTNQPAPEELSDCSSQIGIWRSQNEFSELARDAGWSVEFLSMPAEFYASYYRYDAVLSR